MLAFVLAAQIAAFGGDSTYATPALRALVDSAASSNRVVPPGLASYRARVESELAVLIRRPAGTESAIQIEQVASAVRWRRTGAYEQRVIGYRAQLAAFSPSVLDFLQQAWTVPVLYGNRLSLLFGVDTTRAARRRDTAIVVVHPFAPDREGVYRYTGGDTVVTLRLPDGRRVPLVRVHVEPRETLRQRTGVFRGDIDVDATRLQIVRMRGTLAFLGGHTTILGALKRSALKTMFVVDLTSGEFDGAYWLPTFERIEGQIATPIGGDARTTLRVVSRFTDYVINDTTVAADTLRAVPHRVTYAPGDSVSAYRDWRAGIGAATGPLRSDDYIDLAPGYWRPGGRPRVDPRLDRFGDFLRLDRVEGLYTGAGIGVRFRDAAPGLVASANGGFAWTEKTARGALGLTWTRGAWQLGVRAARTLDNTNDFRTTFTSGPTIEALVTQDDYDYVDRRTATASVARVWSGAHDVVARVELGAGDDRGERRRLTRTPIFPFTFMGDSIFRPNRLVTAGSYSRLGATIDVDPDVDLGFVHPGVGARLHYEWGGGTLGWQRIEGRVVGRRFAGPFTLEARADAGVVAGRTIPTQRLFEIGTAEGLVAYDYKQFGGDRAAVLQSEIGYTLPVWWAPLHLGAVLLPAVAPELAVGVRSGWAEAGTAAGRDALARLGRRVDPATDRPLALSASTPTDGWRTSLEFLVRTFGGTLGVGAARSLDGRAPRRGWNLLVTLGASL